MRLQVQTCFVPYPSLSKAPTCDWSVVYQQPGYKTTYIQFNFKDIVAMAISKSEIFYTTELCDDIPV